MPDIALWGATGPLSIQFPQRPAWGLLMLLLYLAALAGPVYAWRDQLPTLRHGRAWATTLALALAAFALSQVMVIPITTANQLAPLAAAENPAAYAAALGTLPLLAAAVLVNPPGAMLVGLAGGLGRALWQTHQLLTPLHWAVAGLVAGWLWQQNFRGRGWRWLRQPWIAGPLSLLPLIFPIALAAFVDTPPDASPLLAFDYALSTARAHLITLLIEGVVAGIVMTLVQRGVGELLPARPAPIASPFDRSLRWQLLGSYLAFAAGLTALLIALAYSGSVNSALDLVLSQMTTAADEVADHIPAFMAERQNLLREYARADELLGADETQQRAVLARLFRSSAYYRRVLVVDAGSVVRAAYPPAGGPLALTGLEQSTVAETLRTNTLATSNAFRSAEDGFGISFVAPIGRDSATPEGALVGRTPEVALQELILGLQGTMGEGQAFLVDSLDHIIAHPDPDFLLQTWTPPSVNQTPLETGVEGVFAYEGRAGASNARQIVVYVPGKVQPWTVVIQVPYAVVLRMALDVGLPLTAVLLTGVTLFAVLLALGVRRTTRPLNDLVRVTQDIAAGNLDTAITVERQDEIGQLGLSFGTMQRSLQKRLDELSLLLNVSQDVSTSIDIRASMPFILQGVLRGTGAAGVRIVVRNPTSPEPIRFAEGPAAPAMAAHDRRLMTLTRREGELHLATARAVATRLNVPEAQLPVRAVVALPLRHSAQFFGTLWLGYRQSHEPDGTEWGLLRTLASQAAMLVVNGHLYANAEGGRRRLAAVLASTTDAVIVTDQSDRVLFVNPAMERAFGIAATRVHNQPVTQVLADAALLEAVTGPMDRARGKQIPIGERTWYANPSTIISREGQIMGRVVVLHDITALKEVDRLKTEFVDTITHDLRTPLAHVDGFAYMLAEAGELNAEQKEYVEGIKTSVHQLLGLVADLLDLSHLESGIGIVREPISIRGLLQDLAVGMTLPAKQAGLNIRLELADDLPIILGDAKYLHKALDNLVSNALKYAPNSGDLILSAQRSADGDAVILTVRDHGPGIPRDDLERIFEKFYRVNGHNGVKGSGIGLAIVRSAIERHGGRVWCESEPGQGTTFFIALPSEEAKGGALGRA